MTRSSRTVLRAVRRRRIRGRLRGTAVRPRLSVFRSARHVTVQLIDDTSSATLLGVSDVHLPKERGTSREVAESSDTGQRSRGVSRAFALGKFVAEQALARGITAVVFDRGGYAYHGQVKAIAEGARAGSLTL